MVRIRKNVAKWAVCGIRKEKKNSSPTNTSFERTKLSTRSDLN